MLAQWIMHMLAQQQGAGIQYFNPNTPLGQLQESFGVEAPWLSPFPSNNRLE